MKEGVHAFERVILVCANERSDGRAACGNDGIGRDICMLLKEAVLAAGLSKKLRVVRCGCFDSCARGPVVCVQPADRWFYGVGVGDVPAIMKAAAEGLA